jgi:hypothetical protein
MSGRVHVLVAALVALPLLAHAQETASPVTSPPVTPTDAATGSAGMAPGEEIEWRVDFLGVKTGRARLAVGRAEGDIWPVVAQAKTEGVATLLTIREHYVSYWHSAERRSNGNDLEAVEMSDHHTERQRFDRTQGKATVTWWRKGRGEKQKVVVIPPDVHDLASAMLWLRVQPLEDGAHYDIPVFTGDEIFTLRASVAGRERVSTGIGDVDTIRVDVLLGFKDKFETRRASHIWFSEDLRHVPVKMSAEFAVGSVVATVTTYKPGSQVASR